MRVTVLLLFLLLVMATLHCDAAKILALLPTPSPGHHHWNRALMLALAAKGHQVTVFTPNAEEKPVANLRQVVVDGVHEEMSRRYDYVSLATSGYVSSAGTQFLWGRDACEATLKSSAARRLLDMAAAKETFDLVVVEMTAALECLYGFVERFGNPPVLGVTAQGLPPWAQQVVGNPINPSYMNTYLLPFADRMSFRQRAANAFFHLYATFYRDLVHLPLQDRAAKRFFGEGATGVAEAERRVSMVLANHHFSYDYPQPYVPALVPVGGMHTKDAEPLPQDLKKFLDDSKKGVVVVSLGTQVKCENLDPAVVKSFSEAFAGLSQEVIWRWDSDKPPENLPKNVKIVKSMPQNDVLGHPKVKAFVTNGGLLSMHEAVYHGVPVVGVPIFGDQFSNVQKVVHRGAGERLDFASVTKQSLLSALNAVLYDNSYREKMKKMSVIFRDRPETPLKTAVYWAEYAIRYKGAPHLRCASLDLTWYQLLLLDVIAVVLGAVMAALTAVYLVLRTLFRLIFRRGGSSAAATLAAGKKKLKKQ